MVETKNKNTSTAAPYLLERFIFGTGVASVACVVSYDGRQVPPPRLKRETREKTLSMNKGSGNAKVEKTFPL